MKFKIFIAIMLLLSVITNRHVMKEVIEMDKDKNREHDKSIDYKYLYINYISWILILCLLYCVGFFLYFMYSSELIGILQFHKFILVELFGTAELSMQSIVIPSVFTIAVFVTMTMHLIENQEFSTFVLDVYPSINFPEDLLIEKSQENKNDFTFGLIELINFIIFLMLVYVLIIKI